MNSLKPQPRGVALVIVLVVVGLSTVLAFGLVNSQGILTQASANGSKALQADALAESGVQLAAYYLENPTAAPILNAAGHYPGQDGVSLGSGIDGTVDITVTKLNATTFSIACRGSSGASLHRSVAATAAMEYAYVAAHAATVNGGLNIYSNMEINGSIHAQGQVTVYSGARVNGTIYSPQPVQGGGLLGFLVNIVSVILGGGGGGNGGSYSGDPTPKIIKDYRTYAYQGRTYNATQINSTSKSGTLGPTDSNPLGVYYSDNDVLMTAQGLTINGTLHVRNGKLKLKNNVTINAPAGMPGLIVENDVTFNGSRRKLTVNGLSWIGGKLTRDGITSNNEITFNGAVQFGSSGAVDSALSATVKINYDRAKAAAVDFTPNSNTTPFGLRLTSFAPTSGD